MRLLIVEDDENKRTQLTAFISVRFPEADISTARSFQSGLRQIVTGSFDLIILDMSMPTFDVGVDEDGGRPQVYAGREILRQMDRRKIVVPVVIVTQFETFGEGDASLTLQQLAAQLKIAHPHTYFGAVYYNAAYEDWKEELAKKLEAVVQGDLRDA